MHNDVKIRLITEQVKNPKAILEIAEFMNNCNVEVKYLKTSPSVELSIYDKRRVLIRTSPTEATSKSSSMLFSDNKCLLTIINGYFDSLWRAR